MEASVDLARAIPLTPWRRRLVRSVPEGVIPSPVGSSVAPMKATATCPKCQSQHIARVTHVADATGYVGFGNDITANGGRAPVARRLLASVAEDGTQKTTGDVEAYVCTQCGYFEEYLADPTKVDWKHVVGAYAYKKASPPYR